MYLSLKCLSKFLSLFLILFLILSCNEKSKDNSGNKVDTTVTATKVIPSKWIKQLGAGDFGSSVPMTLGDEWGVSMVQDKYGNLIIAGNSSREAPLVSNGSYSFIMKLDQSGDLKWLVQFDQDLPYILDPNISSEITAVTVDKNGNIYATGFIEGSFIEGDGGTDDADIFVIKLNSDGEFIWGKQFGDTSVVGSSGSKIQDYVESIIPGYVVDTDQYDVPLTIAVDDSENVYIGGYTYGTWIGTSGGSGDALMLKLDSVGDIIWVKQIGSEYNGYNGVNSTAGSQQISSIAIDDDQNIYGSTTVAYSNFGEARAGAMDCVVFKFSKSGTLLWLKQLGADEFGDNASSPVGNDYCDHVAIDSNKNVYAAGNTNGSLNEIAGGAGDAFIMKLTTDGNFEWLIHFGDHEGAGMGSNLNNTDGKDEVFSLFIDDNDKIYIGGSTKGAIAEENDTASQDVFVINMNTDGSFNWVRQIGSGEIGSSLVSAPQNTDGNEALSGISVDSSGNIFGVGVTTGSLGEASSGEGDVFIFKLEAP